MLFGFLKKKAKKPPVKSEMTVNQRASAAKELLQNQIFSEAVNEIRGEIIERWEVSAWNATEEREFYWQYLRALSQATDRLNGYIQAATLERADIEERQGSDEDSA